MSPFYRWRAAVKKARFRLLRLHLLPLLLYPQCVGLLRAAQDLPRGRLIEKVACRSDAAQTYALYLPSDYTKGVTGYVVEGH
jgi:hypothetical protein